MTPKYHLPVIVDWEGQRHKLLLGVFIIVGGAETQTPVGKLTIMGGAETQTTVGGAEK